MVKSNEMLGLVGFDGLKVFCVIGDLPHERVQEQLLLIDLRVEADFGLAAGSDLLKDTVDYVHLANVCRDVGRNGKYHMVEKYAAEVLKTLLMLPIKSAWIRVRKPGSIEGADCAVVELKL